MVEFVYVVSVYEPTGWTGGLIHEPGKSWRLIDVLREATEFLSRGSVDCSRLTAERMLASVLGCNRVTWHRKSAKKRDWG